MPIKQITTLAHVIAKPGMYVGSVRQQTIDMLVYTQKTGQMESAKMKFTPALMKIIDEVLVNAIDRHTNFPNKVKRIDIEFERDTGRITVTNDGPGFDIEMVETVDGRKMYSVQMAFSEFRSGSNLDDDNDEERCTGGTFGYGVKLTAAYSSELVVYTIDIAKKISMQQLFRDRLSSVGEPDMIKNTKALKVKKNGETSVSFIPSYAAMGYSKGYSEERDGDTISTLIHTRAIQAAAFAGCDVYWNDEKIEVNGLIGFAEMFYQEPFLWSGTISKGRKKTDKLEVCIGVSNKKFQHMSLINGIAVYKGGNHLKHIQNLIVENFKPRVMKLLKKAAPFNKNLILNNMFVFVKGSIIKPEFSSQTKTELADPIEKFADYKFKKGDYDSIWQVLEDAISSGIMGKVGEKKTRVSRTLGHIDKLVDAKYAGQKAKSSDCTIIIAEGSSAVGTAHEGIVSPKTKLSYDYYGTYSIQGVPMNGRKESSVMMDKKSGEVQLIRSARLKANERLSSLVKIIGLDFSRKYDNPKDMATLRYGRAVVAADQDEDGKGNIFGLIMVFFYRFWPALLENGYLSRLNTPIIRAYPKAKKKFVEEFYYTSAFEAWMEKTGAKNYTIKYFKGLGSHKKQDIGPMFSRFENMLVTYIPDESTEELMEAYYGKKTAERKKLLSTPVDIDPSDNMRVSASEQLNLDTKSYQRDNIWRKLSHVFDGLVPARRKLLYSGREVFGKTPAGNEEMKVNAFTNKASSMTHYHHGEASLADTCARMAQSSPGMQNLPYLYPEGQFGTRKAGGKDFASPRYTFTRLNQRLCWQMFPPEDDCLLEYTFDDNHRCEPVNYIPIIPTAILESREIPATGWKSKVWARDVTQVIANVRDLINGKIKKARPMGLWKNKHRGEVREVNGKLYSMGDYKLSNKNRTLTITEIPMSLHSSMFSEKVSKKKKDGSETVGRYCLVDRPEVDGKIYDGTNDDGVHIELKLKEGAFKMMEEEYGDENFDCVEDWARLKVLMDDHLNMIMDGRIVEFKTYESIVDAWFPARKKLYEERINRMLLLCRLRIAFLENIIRFSDNHDSYAITSKMTREKVDGLLDDNGYQRFNHVLLASPKFTPTDQLEDLITGEKASYDYLVNMRYGDLLKGPCKARAEKLAKEKAQLAELEKDSGKKGFVGKKTWLRELNALEETIELGLKTDWRYGEVVPKYK